MKSIWGFIALIVGSAILYMYLKNSKNNTATNTANSQQTNSSTTQNVLGTTITTNPGTNEMPGGRTVPNMVRSSMGNTLRL